MRRITAAPLAIGQPVHVNVRHRWFDATVHAFTRTTVDIAPTATPSRVHTVTPWIVRPATGARLLPVAQLGAGDQVVTFDGTTLQVAACAQTRQGWWLLTYTTGQHAVLPPHAVVRILDTTPEVTVNGQPLTTGWGGRL